MGVCAQTESLKQRVKKSSEERPLSCISSLYWMLLNTRNCRTVSGSVSSVNRSGHIKFEFSQTGQIADLHEQSWRMHTLKTVISLFTLLNFNWKLCRSPWQNQHLWKETVRHEMALECSDLTSLHPSCSSRLTTSLFVVDEIWQHSLTGACFRAFWFDWIRPEWPNVLPGC